MIQVHSFDLRVLNMRLRMPFRYGIVTLTALPHLFVRANASINGKPAAGTSADHLPPKWFTKNPNSHVRDDLTDMIACIRAAAKHGADGQHATPYAWWQHTYAQQKQWASTTPHPPLLWNFGVSLMERALLDAFCRSKSITFSQAIRQNQLGLPPEQPGLLPPQPLRSIIARHTVGLVDPILESDIPPADRVNDGLPQSLDQAIRAYQLTHFKIKLAGDPDKDLARLRRLAEVIERETKGNYAFSLDANENYKQLDPFRQLWNTLSADKSLANFLSKLLFIEQPLHRDVALSDEVKQSILGWPDRPPLVIDESDGDLTSLPRALECGYVGTSHKNCKGIFKGIANACLIESLRRKNPGQKYMLSGEDLSNVGPVSLLQDTAVAANLGISSIERNGHHYFKGLSMFPQNVQQQVLKSHPDLYRAHDQSFPTLNIRNGRLAIDSLIDAPFGVGFDLDISGFTPLDQWTFDSFNI